MVRRRRQRRGVLLLIVLSLLVLFLLVGLSFMVSASQFNRLAKTAARTDMNGMPGHKLADSVMYQLLRGTKNPYSSIQGHSLLEDLYGRDYMIGQARTVAGVAVSNISLGVPTTHQIQQISFNPNPPQTVYGDPYSEVLDPVSVNADRPEARDDYYAGCVLTFLNGNAKGTSTRVLEYKPQATTPFLRIEGVSVVNKKTGVASPPIAPSSEPLRFIINGRPFNGSGAGYNVSTGRLDNTPTAAAVPIAFMPNYKAYTQLAGLVPHTTGRFAFNVGGLDESYDSVDYQNMFLGKTADITALENAVALPNTGDANTDAMLQYLRTTGGATPSFHRPYLMRHLHSSNPTVYEQVKHAISMRPSSVHHPSFTGSNPAYNEFVGPWDVDNDADGVPDSNWIDAGLSPVSAPDGRLYKPLVAIYAVDMDGRGNINASDSIEHAKTVVAGMNINTNGVGVVDPLANTIPPTDIAAPSAFGMGYGPADIILSTGGFLTPIRNRYLGYDRETNGDRKENLGLDANLVRSWSAQSAPGRSWGEQPDPKPAGFTSNDDFWRKQATLGTIPAHQRTLPTEYGLVSSVAESGLGSPTDYRVQGLPFLDATGNMVWSGPRVSFGIYDSLDDPYELDLLNPTTHDSPYGLAELMVINRVDPLESSRLALPGFEQLFGFVGEFNQFTTHSFSIPAPPTINAGRYRLTRGLKRSLREMFAAKIQQVRGIQKTDVPGIRQSFIDAGPLMAPEFTRGEKLDLNRALSVSTGDSTQQKAEFARHLFNLMMLFWEWEGQNPDPIEVGRLAQWSINVVDFGDADSVMTRFEYDVNPFDTNNTTDVVWGMEHPELLLTESLAFHDRRAADTEDDPNSTFIDDGDDHPDSIEEPQGSLFIELYCPRGKAPPHALPNGQFGSRGPEDIYTTDPMNQQLDLSRVDTTGRPVWRLAMTVVTTPSDPQSPHQQMLSGNRSTQFNDVPLERFIYFTNTLPAGADPSDEHFYRRNDPVGQLLVEPSSYLVLAPNDITPIEGPDEIDLAERYGPTPPAGQPNISMFGRKFVVESDDGNGCNVSEPEGGYDTAALPSDEPLDLVEGLSHYPDVKDNETIENYRTVILQRLADPNLPWNATTNPYLTLDWIPVDLTVFNSEYDATVAGTADYPGKLAGSLEIVSRERTGRDPRGPNGMRISDPSFNIWSAWSDSDRGSNGRTLADTLGFLNDSFGPPNPVTGKPVRPNLRTTGTYAGAPSDSGVNLVNGFNATLSSLVWHNRPYANPYELLLVPACSSARLTSEYTVSQVESPITIPLARAATSKGTFGHLLNFFESSRGIPGDTTRAKNAFRIFDFVSVPSPFIGTKKWLSSTNPDYTYVSAFREPGKVNINTATGTTLRRVGFDSLLDLPDDQLLTNRQAFEESLAGYDKPYVSPDLSGEATAWGYFPDGRQPAERPNPVRAGVAADLIGRLTPPPTPAVDGTMLRSKSPPVIGSTPGEHPQPALAPFQKPRKPSDSPELDENSKDFVALQNPRTNAYFRYRDLIKMGNSITTQSNVYAVWITVGYFEIEPNYDPTNTTPYFVDAFHPDGYRFGLEMGSDVGDVIRDRAFYIIDRSVPVAFEPGVNHNVDDAILVRRQLE